MTDSDPRRPLAGQSAIVTGAGVGLGRLEALLLAELGAGVVVNDLGTGLDGAAAGSRADDVVAEIRAAGGEAVANHDDVADFAAAEALVAQAIDTYGDLHILVNNAGILRERMLYNMDESDWDDVVRVHLKGHFATSRWACRHWRDRSQAGAPVAGRIVNTASEAFLSGVSFQANYAAAKAGIVALTTATAQSMHKHGVTANAICPKARTRMTEDQERFHIDEGEFDRFAPEHVPPLVAYLASPAAARVTAQVFIVYGRAISLLHGPTLERRFVVPDTWTFDAVDRELTPAFADRDPIGDSFVTRIPNVEEAV